MNDCSCLSDLSDLSDSLSKAVSLRLSLASVSRENPDSFSIL